MTTKIDRLIFVLPSHNLEDFPETLPEPEAENLLASWTALWHPRLLARFGVVPEWKRADSAALDVEQALVVCPMVSKSRVDEVLRERIATSENLLLDSSGNREQVLAQIFESVHPFFEGIEGGSEFAANEHQADRRLLADGTVSQIQDAPQDYAPNIGGGSISGEESSDSGSELTQTILGDFYALGYLYLQVQILTRRSRYSSTLNQPLFDEQIVEAAQAFLAGDQNQSDVLMQSCFDSLAQERDHYFSNSVSLIDLSLVNSQTLGGSLDRQVARAHPCNMLISGKTLKKLEIDNQALLEKIRSQIDSGQIEIVGGLADDSNTQRLSLAGWQRAIEAGRQAFADLQIDFPKVYSQLDSGMVYSLPSTLIDQGYVGAILSAWLGGKYPETEQAKIKWEGPDGRSIDAISGAIVNASEVSAFLSLGSFLSRQLDYHHAPTLLLAHWPGIRSDAFEDFLRITARGPAMGRWSLLSEYFSSTQQPYNNERFSPFAFTPGDPDSESSTAILRTQLLAAEGELNAARTFVVLAQQIHAMLRKKTGLPVASTTDVSNRIAMPSFERQAAVAEKPPTESATPSNKSADTSDNKTNKTLNVASSSTPTGPIGDTSDFYVAQHSDEIRTAAIELDSMLRTMSFDDASREAAEALFSSAKRLKVEAADELARSICKPSASSTGGVKAASDTSPAGVATLVLNSQSAPTRLRLANVPGRFSASKANRIYASEASETSSDPNSHVVVDLPPLGYVHLPNSRDGSLGERVGKSYVHADESGSLSNEFLDCKIDPSSGRLQGIFVANKRGNRLAGQLAMRDPIRAKEQRVRSQDGDTESFGYSTSVAEQFQVLTRTETLAVVECRGYLAFERDKVGDFKIRYSLERGSRILRIEVELDGVEWPDDQSDQNYICWRTAWGSEAASLKMFDEHQRMALPKRHGPTPLIEIDDAEHAAQIFGAECLAHRRIGYRFLDSVILDTKARSTQVGLGAGLDVRRAWHVANAFQTTPTIVSIDGTPIGGQTAWFFQVAAENVSCEPVATLVSGSGTIVGCRLEVRELMGKATTAKIECLRNVPFAQRVSANGRPSGTLVTSDDQVSVAIKSNERALIDLFW